jgi:hypothetical protein
VVLCFFGLVFCFYGFKFMLHAVIMT